MLRDLRFLPAEPNQPTAHALKHEQAVDDGIITALSLQCELHVERMVFLLFARSFGRRIHIIIILGILKRGFSTSQSALCVDQATQGLPG